MQLGNTIKLAEVRQVKKDFTLKSIKDYVDCVSVIAHLLREGKRLNITIEEQPSESLF